MKLFLILFITECNLSLSRKHSASWAISPDFFHKISLGISNGISENPKLFLNFLASSFEINLLWQALVPHFSAGYPIFVLKETKTGLVAFFAFSNAILISS